MLLINQQYWAEIFAQEPGNGAKSMRHAAYRQFVLWLHGRLGHNWLEENYVCRSDLTTTWERLEEEEYKITSRGYSSEEVR